ncbi:MAG: hypothetical protein V3U98_02460 [Acidobacteriota bacterium]
MPAPERSSLSRLLAAVSCLAGLLVAGSCRPAAQSAEREIEALVLEALEAVKAKDVARLDSLSVQDPRYQEAPGMGGSQGGGSNRIRLRDFCTTPGFDYDPPQMEISVLRSRAVVVFELPYRFRRREAVVERLVRVTLFVERRPRDWRIVRDSLAFPSEP